MQNSVLYSLRIAALVTLAAVTVLAASFYASLYVRSLLLESGVAAAVGVVGALFAVLLLFFVTAFAVAWTFMLHHEHRHTH
jgi:hypothetical protein